MPAVAPDKVRGLDPHTGEPFYWRGWYDGIRCNGPDGTHVTLRNSEGKQTDFVGRVRSQVIGRMVPPFKTVPRYVDLYLFRTEHGTWVAQRRWISEAHGEEPCHYAVVRAKSLQEMRDVLLNWDPVDYATNLYPEDEPGGKRRNDRMREWLRSSYASRVDALIRAAS